MKKKIDWIGAFLVVFLILCGCSATGAEKEAMSVSEEEIVQGYSLQMLGYYVDLPANLSLKGVKNFHGVSVMQVNGEYTTDSSEPDNKYTVITVTPSAGEDFAILYLQAFYNADLKAKNARIVIDEKTYTPNELKSYRVYKDDTVSVYNITSLVKRISLEQKIKEYSPSDPFVAVNETWLLVEQYYNENISKFIKPMVMRIAAARSPSSLDYGIVISDIISDWMRELGMPENGVRICRGRYGERWGSPYSEKLIGEYDMYAVRISDEGDEDVEYEPILFLQAFYQNEFYQDDACIWKDGKNILTKDLKEYIIFKDLDVIVYDFTELICPGDFRGRLTKRLAEEGKDPEEFQWAFELETYLQRNKDWAFKHDDEALYRFW